VVELSVKIQSNKNKPGQRLNIVEILKPSLIMVNSGETAEAQGMGPYDKTKLS